MVSITVIIHTHNEEENIKECIEKARLLSDDILVIDMESTDKTTQIAKAEKVTVLSTPFSHYVEPARAFGIRKAESEWVCIIDADERMTRKLASEIKYAIDFEPSSPYFHSYFRIPRKNIFGKKVWLKHGGWWPDLQIRVINKIHFREWPKQIHSTPVIDGIEGHLKEPLLHYFHGNLETMVNKTVIFENIESDLLYQANKPVSTKTFFRKFFGELYRRLIKQKGFLDGPIGIIESIYQAFSKTITYLYLYEKKNSSTL